MLRRERHQTLAKGWHRDPTGRHQYREWDGTRWTEHVCDNGVASVDPFRTRRPTRKTRRLLVPR